MYEAMHIAATGLHNQQRRLDTIANNVANVNSAAYKSSRLDFKDALYTAGITPGRPRTPEGNQQKGHGVMVAGITKDYSTGGIQRTDRALDVAIQGEGFFALEGEDGNTVYTRNGSFNLSTEDDGAYLVNSEGLYVRDINDARIRIPDNTTGINIGADGLITFVGGVVGEEGEAEVVEIAIAELGFYTFRNLTGLASIGGGNYAESAASGERLRAENAVVRQGMMEMSNVRLADEMTRLIRTQRVFQLSSRALTTADEMEGIANNMRR